MSLNSPTDSKSALKSSSDAWKLRFPQNNVSDPSADGSVTAALVP